MNIQLVQEVCDVYLSFYIIILLIFLVGIHKRSWLQMLNPLARHKSNRSDDATLGGTSDFELPLTSDATAYTGKMENPCFFSCFALCKVDDY